MAASALLVGATGLVGRECLRLLLADEFFDRVVVLARRPLSGAESTGRAKLEAHVVDFDRLDERRSLVVARCIFCALGTTIRQAGSRERFRRVDFDYPLTVARLGLENGADHFLLVSALGANAGSRVFYNRVKGELEDAVLALGYPRLTIVRPSLLLGDRAERRFGEELGKKLAFLTPRSLRPVQASAVAATLVRSAREQTSHRRIVESADIR